METSMAHAPDIVGKALTSRELWIYGAESDLSQWDLVLMIADYTRISHHIVWNILAHALYLQLVDERFNLKQDLVLPFMPDRKYFSTIRTDSMHQDQRDEIGFE